MAKRARPDVEGAPSDTDSENSDVNQGGRPRGAVPALRNALLEAKAMAWRPKFRSPYANFQNRPVITGRFWKFVYADLNFGRQAIGMR